MKCDPSTVCIDRRLATIMRRLQVFQRQRAAQVPFVEFRVLHPNPVQIVVTRIALLVIWREVQGTKLAQTAVSPDRFNSAPISSSGPNSTWVCGSVPTG